MCGISGIIRTDNQEVNYTEILRMNNTLIHRGPDGDGFYLSGNVALAHRRLAILGLGPEGKQPMAFGDKYVITYNGEIYNYLELGKELQQAGYAISFQTDTEVLLKAYDYWGVRCLTHFNGMWSFALYDIQKGIIFCSRDRFGVKPFYYTQNQNRFIFGSEIRALLSVTGDSKVNEKILLDYLFTGLEDHTNECFFEGIVSLPAAHFLVYKLADHSHTISPYYSLYDCLSTAPAKHGDALEEFSLLLQDAVQLRLRSDVKVGSCLSGGLDSSAVASLASKIFHQSNNEQFTGIHAKSVEKVTDESSLAKSVASNDGIKLVITEPGYDDLSLKCRQIIEVMEEPFGSPSILMQSFVMQSAQDNGIKVLLDGQGGDEMLLGYERYFANYLNQLPVLQRLTAFRALSRNSKLSLKSLLQYYFYFSFPAIRKQRIKERLPFINKKFIKNYDFSLLHSLGMSDLSIQEMQVREITRFQLPHLLKYEDRNSMSVSVEARLPYLDFRLVEFCLKLELDWKIRQGWSKYILRKSMEQRLPASIVWRTDKFGFESPAKWLDNNKMIFLKTIRDSQIIANLTRGCNLEINDPVILWRLFNIAAWEKTFSVRDK